MKILFLSAEVAPFAKVGGLADVAGSLPQALKALGHDVRIMMPAYKMVETDRRWKVRKVLKDFEVAPSRQLRKRAYLSQTELGEVPVYLLGTDEWFCDAKDSSTVYRVGIDQYLFFSVGALDACEKLDWIPDVVHCNDWHTGFVPVVMREKYAEKWNCTGSAFTIHNLAYQGEFDPGVLETVGLDVSLFNHHQVEAHGRVNFLKSGSSYADRVNTVSETYAREVQTSAGGCGLDGLMRYLADHGRFQGIANGLDTDVFNPETDPDQASPFSAADLSGKARCRAALLKKLKLKSIPGAPLIGVVSRLSHQKGIDLLVDCADDVCALQAQIVVQGIGDTNLATALGKLQSALPNHVRYVPEFDPVMAQQIYGGCDAFLMPSYFEPCGLGQLIAMRYGTVPIVRKTGGLADTVADGKTGFVFEQSTTANLVEAVSRAARAFKSKTFWPKLVANCMKRDSSWESSAVKYAAMYAEAIAARSADRICA